MSLVGRGGAKQRDHRLLGRLNRIGGIVLASDQQHGNRNARQKVDRIGFG
jgi:hypothetical protein